MNVEKHNKHDTFRERHTLSCEVPISRRPSKIKKSAKPTREARVAANRRKIKSSSKAAAKRRQVGQTKAVIVRKPPSEAVRAELNSMITTLLPDLLSIVRRLSGTFGSTPESLMNQLMATRLLKKPDFPRERNPFIGWVLANLKGVVIDRIRSESSRKRREKAIAINEDDARISTGPELEPALKSLDRVDPDGGMMVRMRYFAGMRIEDIALTFGVDRQTVGRKLKQSLAFLASKMQHD